ncbi:MAG: DNA gyrase inhibitor YacG [Nitrospirae bacterium]|nr:DNA gyrase inhibitor YacG [Nitrospirota bacterium]
MKDRTITCPICKKEAPWNGNGSRPFCSERCRLIDLGKWASDEYRIAGARGEIPDADREEKNNTEE